MPTTEVVVSICCMTYNHEPFIKQCIEGFMMQRTNFAFEVLIHDDASNDRTAKIIQEYKDKFPKIIKPIYQTVNQYSLGKNILTDLLIPLTRGKYIALCEGDDYWTDPLKLHQQVDFLDSNPNFSLCFHNSTILDEYAPEFFSFFNPPQQKRIVSFKDVVKKWQVSTSSMLFYKSKLEIPPWFNKIYNGDLAIQLLLADKGPFRYLPEAMSVYRKHVGGLSYHPKITQEFIYIKIIELLNLINEHFNFKYNQVIKVRIHTLHLAYKYHIIKTKYPNIIYFNPLKYLRRMF